MQSQKELLDSLMGKHRNLDLDDTENRITWRDPDVCKHFLMGFCPYQLFLDTKADLGPCDKTHELYHRNNYEKEAGERIKARYERRFIRFIRDIINVLDVKIQREQARLDSENNEDGARKPDGTFSADIVQSGLALVFSDVQKERLEELEQEVAKKKTELEMHGNHDRFNEAQELFREVEALEQEKLDLHNKAKVQAGWTQQNERCLKMCLVCGAYLDRRRDTQQRIDNHLEGRVHQGYFMMREKLVQLEERDAARHPKERREKIDTDLLVKEEFIKDEALVKDEPENDKDKCEIKDKSSERRSRRKKSRRRRSRSKSRERRKKRSRSKSRDRRKRRRRRSRSSERRRRRRSRSRPRGRRR